MANKNTGKALVCIRRGGIMALLYSESRKHEA